MIKILQIIPSLRKGGAERLTLDICNELQKKDDIKVKLVVLHPENEYEFLSKDIHVELCNSTVLPSISGKSNIDTSDFEKIISDFKPQVIHSHLFEAEMLSRWKPVPGVRYFTHCHDNMKQFRFFDLKTCLNKEFLTNYYEKRLIIKQYLACDNIFIAISKNTESYFKKNLPKKLKRNIILLNNAIDFNHFVNKEEKIPLFEKQLINLVTIGSLTKLKNHLFLLDVVKILNKKGVVKFNLSIIGEGLMRTSIENKISEYQLQNAVNLIGLTNDVRDYLKNADLYVYSCAKEGFGLTLLEAMASGLPVVCLDGKGNRDIIEQGKNGFMIYEQNAELFAEKIIELISNSDLYQTISKNAVKYAAEYNIDKYVDGLIKFYKSVLIKK
jgi:glycosyltransferase involved in cell wall biosynthesis